MILREILYKTPFKKLAANWRIATVTRRRRRRDSRLFFLPQRIKLFHLFSHSFNHSTHSSLAHSTLAKARNKMEEKGSAPGDLHGRLDLRESKINEI